MSNTIYNLCRPAQMPPTAKNVLMAIADRADEQGKCWPSIPGLCQATCYGRTAVIDAIKWLEQSGILAVEKSVGRNNRFVVDLKKVADAVPKAASETSSVDQTSPPGGRVLTANQSACRTGTRPGDGLPPVREADGPVREADPNHQQPSVNHQATTKARIARIAVVPIPEGFPEFWEAYPKKVGRKLAMKAFEKFRPDATLLATMLAAIARHSASEQWRKAGGQYIPHPSTWLNDERWDDGAVSQAAADDTRPVWATRAGFANRFEAENAGCYPHTAKAFENGARISSAKPQTSRMARA